MLVIFLETMLQHHVLFLPMMDLARKNIEHSIYQKIYREMMLAHWST